MNKTDLGKLKRRLSPDGRNPIVIRGWYVNSKKAVISSFTRDLMSMTRTECEKYMQLFKRTLSGDVGRNLSQIAFSMDEVLEGATHARLMRLVDSQLTDEEASSAFVNALIDQTKFEGNTLILLLHDTYDTDFISPKEDEGALEDDKKSNVFKYILCAVCPVKQGKPYLGYDERGNEFVAKESGWTVSAPAMGFLFPCFEDMGANISQALFYSKDAGEDHSDFLSGALAVMNATTPKDSKESFQAVLMDALEEECSLDVVQSVNEQLMDRLDAQKKDKQSEPEGIGGGELAQMLAESGVSDDRVASFREKFDTEFGQGAALPLAGITEDKRFEVRTPDVVVKVSPRQASQIETRVIDGVKYILIPADDGVTVNGISIGI